MACVAIPNQNSLQIYTFQNVYGVSSELIVLLNAMTRNKIYLLFGLGVLCCLFACKQSSSESIRSTSDGVVSQITHAEGFTITHIEDYTVLEVTSAFPGSDVTYPYALVPRTLSRKRKDEIQKSHTQRIIETPIQSIVVTSTTHIPSLEMLEVENALTGFPNLDYISSAKTRTLIGKGQIKELGQNESLNTEIAIELNPDLVVGFGVDGQNKSLNSLEKAGISVLYNGDWVEKDPLGKAEWIKFFGVLFEQEKKADSIFNEIVHQYESTKTLVANVATKPTVLSGAMYKDVWYLPHGDSWPAKLIADAGGNYLWSETPGTGSIALSIESVLEKGHSADFWIAPGQYSSYSKLAKDHTIYGSFEAFKNKKVYTFATKKGETGGMLYYELAPNRPDLVLKDMVHYLHPDLLPNYTPYFFTPLED